MDVIVLTSDEVDSELALAWNSVYLAPDDIRLFLKKFRAKALEFFVAEGVKLDGCAIFHWWFWSPLLRGHGLCSVTVGAGRSGIGVSGSLPTSRLPACSFA